MEGLSEKCSFNGVLLDDFNNRTAGLTSQMLRINGLTIVNVILAAILVIIGTYGSRYRHRAFIGALFQGATILFLPILSYVASNASTTMSNLNSEHKFQAPSGSPSETQSIDCDANLHLYMVLTFAGLVHIIGINTCTIVAASDREGRNIGLPMGLLVQAIWTTYLVISLTPFIDTEVSDIPESIINLLRISIALIFAKMALRYYEFQMARHSVALGRNPLLIVGYIEQLQGKSKYGGVQPMAECCPPPLIVMGEERCEVEKVANGLIFKRMLPNQGDTTTVMNNSGLVTIDKVWLLDDDSLLTPWIKQVCLSFALFKLLRCRYAGYTIAEVGFLEVREFLHTLIQEDNANERVHDLIIEELAYLHDYYYSSIPIHYSNFWLPMVNIITSLFTISYCLFVAGMVISYMKADLETNYFDKEPRSHYIYHYQIYCTLSCLYIDHDHGASSRYIDRHYGILQDVVPVMALLILVVLAEAREIASYICSNWTKVALICRYVVQNNHGNWQGSSPPMQKCVGRVLRWRCKLMKQWDDKMNQCSVLVLYPRRTDGIIALLMHMLHLPDRKNNVKVPGVVKTAIVNTLGSNYELLLTDPAKFLCRSLEGRSHNFLWACESKGISDIILTWHIATSILGVRVPHPAALSEDMIVSTHLSRYCAYLVAYVPELLPDDNEWCKSLYKAVKKDAVRALAGGVAASTAEEDEYNKLISLLEQERAKHHQVLANSVELGKQLARVQESEGQEVAWRLLAGFWSGMILYIAPSDNLKGHADAIARGGELITFVWVLLMHVGIDSRSSTTAAPASAPGV